MKLTTLALLILGGSLFPAWADQPPSATDGEAFQKLRKIVKSRSFYFKDEFATLAGEKDFCRDFMRGLKEGRQIGVVEPYYRTDKLDDPALQPWRECAANPNISEGLQYFPATGTRGFRLYMIDADSNPANGLESVLYSEWDFKESVGPAGFSWWDLKTCQSNGGGGAQQDDKRDADGKGTLGDNYALLVRFKKRTWALTMDSSTHAVQGGGQVRPDFYYLQMFSLERKPEQGLRKNYYCSWTTMRSHAFDGPAAKSVQ